MITGRVNPAQMLDQQGISGLGSVFYNYLEPALVEEALKRNEGTLGKGGSFLVTTGKHTGQAGFIGVSLDRDASWGQF